MLVTASLGPSFTGHLNVDEGLAEVQHTPVQGLDLWPKIWNNLSHGPTDVFRYRIAVDVRQFLVDSDVTEVPINKTEAHRSAALQCLEQAQSLLAKIIGLDELILGRLGFVHTSNVAEVHLCGLPVNGRFPSLIPKLFLPS